MPQIIPIRDLKNISEISAICHKSDEPIFVTKNGYDDMVIMSIEAYEKISYINDIYKKIEFLRTKWLIPNCLLIHLGVSMKYEVIISEEAHNDIDSILYF